MEQVIYWFKVVLTTIVLMVEVITICTMVSVFITLIVSIVIGLLLKVMSPAMIWVLILVVVLGVVGKWVSRHLIMKPRR